MSWLCDLSIELLPLFNLSGLEALLFTFSIYQTPSHLCLFAIEKLGLSCKVMLTRLVWLQSFYLNESQTYLLDICAGCTVGHKRQFCHI